ncbi:hypothetical protein R3P38DRAFT_3376145 [Favolaschia claudopus]|uniref:F-box domain-containing protein n=1 Tax=Favolaschia claudopus TaxID=2862362 RepID=A0AAV9ZIG6_9AGAR
MAAPYLSVPELWHAIVENLEETADLMAASLVCHVFVPAAQKKIFREIFIPYDEEKFQALLAGLEDSSDLMLQYDRVTALSVTTCFVQLLESSPHLIPYVRTLTLHMPDSECLRLLSQFDWICLRCIQFNYIRSALESSSEHKGDEAQRAMIQSIERLASNPSLRMARIFAPPKDWTAADFYSIFQAFPSSLENLALGRCNPTGNTFQLEASPVPRPAIRHLDLQGSPAISAILERAFDFTGLHALCFVDSWSHGSDSFLRRIGDTVEVIYIQKTSISNRDQQFLAHFDVERHFPSLREISYDSYPPHEISPFDTALYPIIASLHPTNKVEKLTFNWDRFPILMLDDSDDESIMPFEKFVLEKMPSLHCVELHTDAQEASTKRGWTKSARRIARRVRGIFPKLWQRNMVHLYVRTGSSGEVRITECDEEDEDWKVW